MSSRPEIIFEMDLAGGSVRLGSTRWRFCISVDFRSGQGLGVLTLETCQRRSVLSLAESSRLLVVNRTVFLFLYSSEISLIRFSEMPKSENLVMSRTSRDVMR
jgi:hypothetical protein